MALVLFLLLQAAHANNLTQAQIIEDNREGAEIPFFIGSALTLLSTVYILTSFFRNKAFRQHPSILIVSRTLCDTGFCCSVCLSWLFPSLSCKYLAFHVSLFAICSQCFLACLSTDLLMSVFRPFSSYRLLSKKYHIGSVLASVLISLLFINVPLKESTGNWGSYNFLGACWFKRWGRGSFNWVSWLYVYAPLGVVYVFSFAALFLASLRLKKGLSTTFAVRQKAIRTAALFVFGFFLYWTIFGILKGILFFFLGDTSNPPRWMTVCLSFTLSCRGVAALIVWVATRSSSSKVQEAEDLSTDPALNPVLRKEVLNFTQRGIRESVMLARQPGQQRSSVTRHEVMGSEFVEFKLARKGAGLKTTLSSLLFGRKEEQRKFLPVQASTNPIVIQQTGAEHEGFVFRDYAPSKFKMIRKSFGVDEAYLNSFPDPDTVAENQATVKETFSEGASGAFMYFTLDDRFIVKTMEKGEWEVLISIVSDFAAYVTNGDTLISRFFGCHSIKMYGETLYFCVIESIFPCKQPNASSVIVHERYDLKGSRFHRSASKPKKGKKVSCIHCHKSYRFGKEDRGCGVQFQGMHQPSVVMKDNDITHKIALNKTIAQRLKAVAVADVNFLRRCEIMDYSLLLGVHQTSYVMDENQVLIPMRALNKDRVDHLLCSTNPRQLAQSEQPFFRADNGGLTPAIIPGPSVFYFGIIDMLQKFTLKKRMEQWIKSFLYCTDRYDISSAPPDVYARRFLTRVVDDLFFLHGEPPPSRTPQQERYPSQTRIEMRNPVASGTSAIV